MKRYHLLKLINHDIRSPFNRLFALLQLFELESGELSDQQNEYLDSMYLSILSGLEMIQNLRDMRELDANHIEIVPSEINVKDIIDASIRTFSKQIELKQIQIFTKYEGDQFAINTDGYYLQRVVENVFSNAIKFSKEGKKVEVVVHADDLSLSISIRDFGEGIKHDEEMMLFQKFKKLSSFATGGEGSLGLGLYNAMAIIKMMNGNISLNREVEPKVRHSQFRFLGIS
jgi:two-component system sensor histidine kinase/response regulator